MDSAAVKNSVPIQLQELMLSVLDGLPDCGIIVCAPDESLTLLYANDAVPRMLGQTALETGTAGVNPVLDRMSHSAREALRAAKGRYFSRPEGFRLETRLATGEGTDLWVMLTARLYGTGDGARVVCLIQDISQAKWTQELLRQERHRNKIISSFSNQMLFEYSMACDILLVERGPDGGAAGHPFQNDVLTEAHVWPEDRREFLRFCHRMRQGVETCETELRLAGGEGPGRWVSLLAQVVRSSSGRPIKYIGRMLDIHESKREMERLINQAQRDSLTQLYNRSMIEEKVESALHDAERPGGSVMLLDIDDFKQINDRFGHYFGDFIIRSAADLLRDVSDALPGAAAGRLGGDEFLLLLPGFGCERAEETARGLLGSFGTVYRIPGHDQGMSFSIGIASYPECGRTYREVFQKADIALYQVKTSGKSRFRFYHRSDDAMLRGSADYFNTYEMEDGAARKTSDFEEELPRMVLESLNRAPNLDDALPLVLRVIGRQFGLDKVSIMEVDAEESAAFCVHQWALDGMTSQKNEYLRYGKDVMNAMLSEYVDNAIIASEDTEQSDLSNIYHAMAHKKGARAFLHYATYSDSVVRYVFQFEHYRQPRAWAEQDVALITEIADIMFNHLLRTQVRAQASEMLSKHINFDSLTKLPTLPKFLKEAERLIRENPQTTYGVVYADFRGFKQINDLLGYVVGDRVLCDFSDVIKLSCRTKEQCCRISGDKFVGLVAADNGRALCGKIDQTCETFRYVMDERHPGVEMGLAAGAYIVHKGDALVAAIDNANAARKVAKRTARGRCVLFDDELRRQVEIEHMSRAALRGALDAGEFVVYYQPKMRLSNRSLAGAEALVRWRKGDGRLILPDRFIPAFETNGLITCVDHHVLETVCRLLRRLLDEGRKPVQISVNLSRRDYQVPNAMQELVGIVDRYGVPHNLLEFELTESVFMDPNDSLKSFLSGLLGLGFDVSIDDFGYGYSSLNILSQVPASVVKLDRAFLTSSDRDERSRYILEQMVFMARNVGLKVVCEGIEREEQAVFCNRIGCGLAQGFLFAHPMPEEAFAALL